MIELPKGTAVIRCETSGKSLWYTEDGVRDDAIVRICPEIDVARLPMPFDPKVVGMLSGTIDERQFMQWFPPTVICGLIAANYRVFRFVPDTVFADDAQVWFKGRDGKNDITEEFIGV